MALTGGVRRTTPFVVTRTMIWITLVAYCVALVGQTTYQNFRRNQDISYYKQEIIDLERKKRILELSLVYYKSNAYKEIEARSQLNMKGKDEHVVAIPQATTEPSLTLAVAPDRPTRYALEIKLPPYKAWWKLFFGREQ
jgi:hypothetical protein